MVSQKLISNSPLFCLHYLAKIKRSFWLVIGITLMATSHICEANSTKDVPNESPAEDIALQINHERYTLNAKQVTLSQMLLSIGKQAGFEVRIHGNLSDTKHDWSYQDISLPDMVRNLVRNYSSVMIYQKSPNSSTIGQLSEIWIYTDNESTLQSSAPIEIQTQQAEHSQTEDNTQIDARRKAQVAQIDRLEGLHGQDVIDSLANIIRSEPDPIIRLRAVSALNDIGGSDVLAALETGMGDNSAKVRTEVAGALGNTQDQRAILLLGQLLMGDKNTSVRQAAVQSLHRYKQPAAHVFIEAAQQDRDEGVRKAAKQTP